MGKIGRERSVGRRRPAPIHPSRERSEIASVLHVLNSNKVLFIIFFACLVMIGSLTVLFIERPHIPIEQALLLSLTLVFAVLSLIGWGLMWLELLLTDFFMALFGLLVFLPTYYVLVAYPERALKPFVLHVVAALLAFGSAMLFEEMYDISPYRFILWVLR